MFYLFMFLFFIGLIVFLISFIIYMASKTKRKWQKRLMLASLCIGIASLVTGIFIGTSDSSQVANEALIIDVTKFSKVSPDELVTILGDPEKKENWQYDNGNQKYDTITYTYCGGECEFHIIDGKVVRFNYFTPEDATNITKLLRKFGLKSSDLEMYASTGATYRYRSKIEGIDDVYIMMTDLKNEKKTSLMRVTYDAKYFNEPV